MARSEGSKAELEFHAIAKKSITQEIPIFNPTDEDWSIAASLQGQHFSGPFSLKVKPKSTALYPITFSPQKHCEVAGLLVLNNLQTNQHYTYALKGVAQEVDPEEHVEIECACNDDLEHTFLVTNASFQDSIYDVITNIPFVSNLKPISIGSGKEVAYTMKFRPKLSGTFTYDIKFVNRLDESFTWFTMLVFQN